MKKNLLPFLLSYLLFPLLLTASLKGNAQQLRFQSCTNCPNNLGNEYTGSMSVPEEGFQYANTIQTMTSSDVASDFGRRNSNSRWHMGVDISPQAGNTDIGDRIYPIETGTIVKIIGTSYKVLVIRGEHRYGYGHIFFDGTPNATTGMRSGDFILKKMKMFIVALT